MSGKNTNETETGWEPTNWDDPVEVEVELDICESIYAGNVYLERPVPSPKEWVHGMARLDQELSGEEPMPEAVQVALIERCREARRRIEARDKTYAHYKDIYTEEARLKELDRKRRLREALKRWMNEDDFGGFKEFLEIAEERR